MSSRHCLVVPHSFWQGGQQVVLVIIPSAVSNEWGPFVIPLDRTRDPLVTRKKGSFAEDRHHANGVRSVETGTRVQRLRGQRGFRRVVRSQMGFLLAVLYAEH